MLNGWYGFNFTYLWILLPALIVSLYAQHRVNSAFKKYSRVGSMRNVTGMQAAQEVARYGGAEGITVRPISGNLTDNFDPRNRTISLSSNVYSASSIAAVGVAAHEAGHAIQNAAGYFPNKIRAALVPVTNFGSRLAFPMILVGLFLPVQYEFVVYAGIILYGLVVLFQLVTLPVEFDASYRAVKVLGDSGILYPDELEGVKKVLTAAAMTYLAASFTAILTLLRFLLIAGNRRGRN